MRRARLVTAVAALLVAACGSGGDGGSAPVVAVREPLPDLSQDIEPAGPRRVAEAGDYFPAHAGSHWYYEIQRSDRTEVQTILRFSVYLGSGRQPDPPQIYQQVGQALIPGRWHRTAEGWWDAVPLGPGTPVGTETRVGAILVYPQPFHAPGSERRILRQGAWTGSFDGDNVHESFRWEFVQRFIGFESLTLPDRTLTQVARFRNTLEFILQPSRLDVPIRRSGHTEDTWWAPDMGMVRSERTYLPSESDGKSVIEVTRLVSGSTSGGTLLDPLVQGTLRTIDLPHEALVYDPRRRRYYASMPSSLAGGTDRIAVVDATTAAVSHTGSPVGVQPGPLAMSADGASLYVGLTGSQELVRLSLPDFTEVWRVRLPLDARGDPTVAWQIAASPTEPDVIAVSTRALRFTPIGRGVVLVRGGVVQPRRTEFPDGTDLLVFGHDGLALFGVDRQSSEARLLRFAVSADGVLEEARLRLGSFHTEGRDPWLDRVPGGVVFGKTVATPALVLAGRAPAVDGVGCRPIGDGDRLVCDDITADHQSRLHVVDARTLVIRGSAFYRRPRSGVHAGRLVPGPDGQVALVQFGMTGGGPVSITLFDSPELLK